MEGGKDALDKRHYRISQALSWIMSNTPTALVQKLWNYCNILRDDGLSYGEYAEQLTFLLLLKMADEQSRPPYLSEDRRRDAASTIP
jgi:type I restriction-modification system DNA methylase subunit